MKRQLLVSYLSITSLVILVLGLPLGVSYANLVDDDARHLWLLLVVTAGVMLGIVVLVSLLLARSLTKPLHDLHDAAVELGRGDLAVRAPVP